MCYQSRQSTARDFTVCVFRIGEHNTLNMFLHTDLKRKVILTWLFFSSNCILDFMILWRAGWTCRFTTPGIPPRFPINTYLAKRRLKAQSLAACQTINTTHSIRKKLRTRDTFVVPCTPFIDCCTVLLDKEHLLSILTKWFVYSFRG